MQSKPHGKSADQLKAMKMAALLQLVKDHHLAQHIHLYRRMRKPALVEALQSYAKAVPSSAPVPMKRKAAPKKKAAPPPKPSKGKTSRNPPLYTKAEGGLLGGATSDFERVYGKMGTRAKPKATTNVSPPPAKRKRKKPKRFDE